MAPAFCGNSATRFAICSATRSQHNAPESPNLAQRQTVKLPPQSFPRKPVLDVPEKRFFVISPVNPTKHFNFFRNREGIDWDCLVDRAIGLPEIDLPINHLLQANADTFRRLRICQESHRLINGGSKNLTVI
jgi:hypothetical protein